MQPTLKLALPPNPANVQFPSLSAHPPALFLQDGEGLELTNVLSFEVLGQQNSYLSVSRRLTEKQTVTGRHEGWHTVHICSLTPNSHSTQLPSLSGKEIASIVICFWETRSTIYESHGSSKHGVELGDGFMCFLITAVTELLLQGSNHINFGF